MIRRLLQLVALVTVLAATVNAQCSLACGFTNMQAESKAQDHSCCHHHRAPQTQHSPSDSCPQVNLHSNDARLDVSRATLPGPVVAVAAVNTVRVSVELSSFVRSVRVESPPEFQRPSAITILRI